MFSDDEDELELLRQYGEKDLNADESDAHSNDEMDSDLEEKIYSMVQYGSGLNKKFVPSSTNLPATSTATAATVEKKAQPETIYAPVETTKKSTKSNTFSAANVLQINSDSEDENEDTKDDSDSEEEEEEEEESYPSTPPPTSSAPVVEEPKVTRYINLDDQKQYMDDEETSDEETELGIKLQELIDEQIAKRQSRSRYVNKPIRVCYGCQQPGHERRDCTLCGDCGGPRHAGDGRCVGARYCGRCKLRGHNQIDCDNKRETHPCRFCHMSYHAADNCPGLLHIYVNEKPSEKRPTPYCYYCTSKGHYGDDCPSLPQYLQTLPSAFTYLSLSSGSRFDSKKGMKTSASSFSNQHQKWSDDSRESSPRPGYGKKRKYNNDSDYEYGRKKSKGSGYNDLYDDSDNDRSNRKKKSKVNSFKDNNAGGKRRRTDLVDNQPSSSFSRQNNSHLDSFFSPAAAAAAVASSSNNNRYKKRDNIITHINNNNTNTGNSNWKAMNNNALPQPIRNNASSSSKNNKGKGSRQQQQQQQQQYNYDGDFPRGNNGYSDGALPRPTSSGVIDLTRSNDNNYNNNNRNNNNNNNNNGSSYSNRAPKYHGGYNRNR